MKPSAIPLESLRVAVYRVPTDGPESDGTFEWDATTLVLVEAAAGGKSGLGYTYADRATAQLIQDTLAPRLLRRDAVSVQSNHAEMIHAIRNLGRPGICSMAIAAVDTALWDLKARLLDLPLVTLIGQVRAAVPLYGSGGFTSYSIDRLKDQLAGWVQQGIPRVKMKIGRDPAADRKRVQAAREAIGSQAELFVDANGAYSRKQALAQAEYFATLGVNWFEEPVSSDDLTGLRLLRDRAPAGMDIAAGEYGYDLPYFRRMLETGAVDVLQADASRCAGLTGFHKVASVAEAFSVPLSAHTAPAVHLHVCAAAPGLRHLEYFHDHVRIEQMFFDGVVQPKEGALQPDLARPGLGLEFQRADAERYEIRM